MDALALCRVTANPIGRRHARVSARKNRRFAGLNKVIPNLTYSPRHVLIERSFNVVRRVKAWLYSTVSDNRLAEVGVFQLHRIKN